MCVEGAKERYAVTDRRREGKQQVGLRVRKVEDRLEVQDVKRFGLVAEWNDNCTSDVAVVPGDIIERVNGVEGTAALEQLKGSEVKVLLQLRCGVQKLLTE